jgi:prepilin-type N-terminal cleavage/methylation domain-containing protein
MQPANSDTLSKKRKLLGFTLVELIVVITILAILGTIGFLSIQGYSASARDGSRISNLSSLQRGLALWKVVA